MHVWKVAERADEEMDGWRPVVCHRDGQRSIIYGGKSCACFASVSHVKAYISDVSSRLALSLSLSSRSHMEISSEEREKKILKVRDVPLTYFRNFVRSHWRGRDHIAFTFNLRSAPTSKMHYLLHFCWFLSCSLQFILKGHVCKRSLLLSLIPISLNADPLGLQDPVRHTLDEQKSTSLTNGAF